MTAQPRIDRHPEVVLEPRSVGVLAAAKALGICDKSVRDEIKSGALRSFRYGNRVLIPVAALDEWIRAHMGQAS